MKPDKKPEKKGFTFDSLPDAHAKMAESSTKVNVAATEAHDEEALVEHKRLVANKDKSGMAFDPLKHAVNAAGEPSVTPKGFFRRKKGAAKIATVSQTITEQQKRDESMAAGRLCADMLITSAVMLGGKEWVPEGIEGEVAPIAFNEQANLQRAFGEYFVAKGINDFPPGIALTVAITSYALPRMITGEETQTRMKRAGNWFKEKWKKWTTPKEKEDAAQPDARDDKLRENDAGKTASSDDVSDK